MQKYCSMKFCLVVITIMSCWMQTIVGFRIDRAALVLRHCCYASSRQPPDPIPRAAVSACIRCRDHYLLVQRGKSPNAGMWSFPGGKIEYAEETVQSARREVAEETTGWPFPLHWHPNTFDTSDSIGEGYHYVIAHCYAELKVGRNESLPDIAPADDAADAKWFLASEIESMETSTAATPGLSAVIRRAETFLEAGLLGTMEK